jgi:UrcA family protein
MIFAVSCALATAMAAPVAMASDSPSVVPVAYGDLNLSSPHDSAVLLHRLREAALEACGASDFSVADYRRSVERSACYRESMDRAVSAVDAPAVSQLYSGRAFASN